MVPIASDDAADARWWPVDDVLADAELWAFADHTAMVRDARAVIERSEARDRSAERLTELFVHADLQWNRAVGDHETLAQPYLAMLARTALEELEGRRP